MHAKYEVSISYGSKVIAKVKVDNRQTNRQINKQTDKHTGQKQYAPDHSIPGHKKLCCKDSVKCKMLKVLEPHLQLKGSNLWLGWCKGEIQERVKDGHLHHMDWKVIPLHNCQGKEGSIYSSLW